MNRISGMDAETRTSVQTPLPGQKIKRCFRGGIHYTFVIILACLLLTACSRGHYPVPVEGEDSTVYRSHTPWGEIVNRQLQESLQSVVRIQSTVFYRTYIFDPDQMPYESDPGLASPEELAVDVTRDNHSSAGTAVAVSQTSSSTALLTTSHIVSYPDTIYHHAGGGASGEERPLEALSIRERVNYLLFTEGGVESFEVEIDEPERDLALLVADVGRSARRNLRSLSFRPGEADNLEWGDLVYAIGYPRGVQMVTSGIISRSSLRRWEGFTVDASFNRGFSGGAIFAVRNDGEGLDWMGMITSASAEREFVLTPGEMTRDEYMPDVPYTDTIYVEQKTRINYGVSHATSISEVRRFFERNSDRLSELGFSSPDFR